jgi:N-dimethylarginine dimethylaminohydrolase
MSTGCESEVGAIEKLLLKHPREAFVDQASVDRQWKELNYLDRPDFKRVCLEFDHFQSLIEPEIAEIHFLPLSRETGLDSIYVRDPLIMTPKGAILGNMGKRQRTAEPGAMEIFLKKEGIPVLGAIEGDGTVEAGDIVLFDRNTIAIGYGYRTNQDGISQLQSMVRGMVKDVVVVHLPHWNGPGDILHLMSFISPIDHDLATVYSRLMPVSFREWLIRRGIKLIEVPDSEYPTMACNILAVAPRKCIMIAGNPLTRKKLENEGVEVLEFSGEELCKKGGGGPTCLTRPLLRSD